MLLEQNFEKICFLGYIKTPHMAMLKNYEKGDEGNKKKGKYVFQIFDNKQNNGNTSEAFMKKIVKIVLKKKTRTFYIQV